MEISRYNELDYLGSEADMAAYLKAALSEEGIEGFLDAAEDVMKARAILQLSRETGIGYQELCKTLSHDIEPSNDAIQRINQTASGSNNFPVPSDGVSCRPKSEVIHRVIHGALFFKNTS
jgi:probable addiction module antidote protein